jgi:hypothetical protein
MRTLSVVLLMLALASQLGAASLQVPTPVSETELAPDMQALLDEAVADGRAVPPEVALANARQFMGLPDLPVVVTGFFDDTRLVDIEMCYYRLRTSEGDLIDARGADGGVYRWGAGAGGPISTEPGSVPTVPFEQARTAAEVYLQARYPGFANVTWSIASEEETTGSDRYRFTWTRILNEHGTRAPYSLRVTVNGISGQVIGFCAPPERITGPTVPVITEAQAREIARTVAPLDPDLAPFTQVQLRLTESQFGVQHLVWELLQQYTPPPNTAPDSPVPDDGLISVDAITGEAFVAEALGSPLSERTRKGLAKLHQQRRPPSLVRLSDKGGERSIAALGGEAQIREGRLWVRAELLRALAARVLAEPGRLKVRGGRRCVDAAAVGGEYRQAPFGQWWVPLRRAVEALGWKVEWRAKQREALVDASADPPRSS